jgi:peptidyl-prolyl cis-trans isomerase C
MALLIALASPAVLAQNGDSGDEVIAHINGEPLTQPQFEQLLQQRTQGRAGQLNDAQRRQFLDEVVNLTLLSQEAENQGLADDPDVVAQLKAIRRALLARAMIQKLTDSDAISDAEIKKAYDKNYGGESSKEYHARHILVDDKATAEDMIAKLDDGADFAKLAEENSTGPTSKKGGDLGWFSPDQMVDAFAAATTKLEKGSYTEEPVKTRFGWHVIKLEDVRDNPPPKLDDVRDKLRSQIAREKVQAHLADLRDKAEVDYEADWAKPGADKD